MAAPAEQCAGCKTQRAAWLEDEGIELREQLDEDAEEWGCYLNRLCEGPCVNPRPEMPYGIATTLAVWSGMEGFDRYEWVPNGLSVDRILRGKDWTQLPIVESVYQVHVDEWMFRDLRVIEDAWLDALKSRGVKVVR